MTLSSGSAVGAVKWGSVTGRNVGVKSGENSRAVAAVMLSHEEVFGNGVVWLGYARRCGCGIGRMIGWAGHGVAAADAEAGADGRRGLSELTLPGAGDAGGQRLGASRPWVRRTSELLLTSPAGARGNRLSVARSGRPLLGRRWSAFL